MWRVPNSARNPLLTQPATARRLSRGLPVGIRMLQALGLNRAEQAWLLGLSPRDLQRAAQQHGPTLSQDQLTRLGLVVAISNALHILYDASTAAGGLNRPNVRAPFGGQTPLEHMRRGGIPTMYKARRLLDDDRGGLFSVTPEVRKAASNVETVIEF